MWTILVLNGPNVNLLGTRLQDLYGWRSMEELEAICVAAAKDIGVNMEFRQTNHEGVLIDWLHDARGKADGIVLNASAHARTSLVLHDAVEGILLPVIELHITNIYRRDSYRPPSYLSKVATGVICGLGLEGYPIAIRAMKDILDRRAAAPNEKGH